MSVLSSFNNNGQLVLGNDAASPQAGSITFNDATGSNGFTTTLGTVALTGSSKTINLPQRIWHNLFAKFYQLRFCYRNNS